MYYKEKHTQEELRAAETSINLWIIFLRQSWTCCFRKDKNPKGKKQSKIADEFFLQHTLNSYFFSTAPLNFSLSLSKTKTKNYLFTFQLFKHVTHSVKYDNRHGTQTWWSKTINVSVENLLKEYQNYLIEHSAMMGMSLDALSDTTWSCIAHLKMDS